ncbi:MAG: AAA family ATPase [Phycisphaerales bacterium]|jgi:predicted ATPase|nr:AAA family ATPase [Phycisphaerales bacterium]
MSDIRKVKRLAMRQFKSIERCDIELSPITILVGRNGVGKSNILDALRFVADALRNTLEYAIRERGGIDQVRRKSLGGRPTNPMIALELSLQGGQTARYSFKIAAVQGREFRVDLESCDILNVNGDVTHGFKVSNGQITNWKSTSPQPAAVPDRLLLVAASGIPEFRPVFDLLTRLAFHNLNPEVMKFPQRPEPGMLLAHDGHNLASVIKQLESSDPAKLERVQDYLQAIGVPVKRITHKQAGALETIEVGQEMSVPGGKRNSIFDAIALSDGTIRALGILVSLVSAGPSLIGIEEPETALHPAAAGVLMEALTEGAERTQLIITCHSPDLLDHESVSPEMIRPVLLENGRTVVGKLDPAKADLMKKHLATAGDLLRLDQLAPDPKDIQRQEDVRGTLWEGIA